MGAKWVPRLLLSLFLLVPATAWSIEIHGRSSTQLEWFNNDFNDQRQVEFGQYLRFSLTDIDKEGKLSFFGYGRFNQDLNNGEGFNARLYYLYGEYRNLFDKVDMRLGRQFVNYAAGTAIIDGGQVGVKNIGPVAFSAAFGRNVIFDLDGEGGHGGDLALALSAYLYGFRATDLEISWFRRWDQWDVARDTIGATVKQNLFNNLKVYGNTRFDLTSETFSEILAGAKYFPISNLVLTGEYYQSYPTFDATSIYSVFAVDLYREAVFRADYTINEMITLNGGYTSQWFGEGGRGHIYHAGCSLRPIEPLLINLEYDNNQGYNGKTNGFLADLYYDLTKTLQLAGGMGYDVYTRDAAQSDGTARLFWFAGKYRLAKNMTASLRIEDNSNERYHNDVQGRFVFNYDF
ncbi:MAG: hypothetical protein EG828_07310 [Deltaproteobacteria bacterium]|nr:hypothetical protein [Deltaproteobacteria bacterium]